MSNKRKLNRISIELSYLFGRISRSQYRQLIRKYQLQNYAAYRGVK